MSRIVYVNGRYLRYGEAGVHVEDRGFQFADSIYEVCEVLNTKLVDETRHMQRLERSLQALQIRKPMSPKALGQIVRQVIRRNRVKNGLVYIQVTRGAAPRDFPFPGPDTEPTVVCIARSINTEQRAAKAEKGIAVKTQPDIRWQRRDIKTVMLLPACLAKEEAFQVGAAETWLLDADGYVTEGASSNAWIVRDDGTVITHPLGQEILPGITRATLIDLLTREQIPFEERKFHVDEARGAREAFITSASGTVMPVVKIDQTPINNGLPGDLTQRLRLNFHQAAEISS